MRVWECECECVYEYKWECLCDWKYVCKCGYESVSVGLRDNPKVMNLECAIQSNSMTKIYVCMYEWKYVCVNVYM